MTESVSPPAARKNPIVMIIVLVAGLIAVVMGIRQMMAGMKEMSGGQRSDASAAIKTANDLVNQANLHTTEAAPLLDTVLHAVDTEGLAPARTSQAVTAKRSADLFSKGATAFRDAAKTLGDAATLDLEAPLKDYLGAKADAYRQFALTKDGGREIIEAALDPAVNDAAAFAARLAAINARIEAATKAGQDAAAKADEIASSHPALFK
jgi:hypothetical protein